MEKIKINLTNGTMIEKPLITAFRGNNGIYTVLDNEMNGTMGLPIILVSKLDNNKLIKIIDQNEWNAVKENLRMIIAGNQVDYVKVEDTLMGDEVFFTQLTLPVASFEALKNNYNPQDGEATPIEPVSETVSPNIAPASPEVVNPTSVSNTDIAQMTPEVVSPTPVVPNVDVAQMTPEAVSPAPVVPNVDVAQMTPEAVSPAPVVPNVDVAQMTPETVSPAPVVPNIEVTPTSPEVTTPTPISVTPEVSPVMPEAPQNSQVEAPIMDQPVVNPINEETTEEVSVDFTADKEAFLKACENMFDALVAKFNK